LTGLGPRSGLAWIFGASLAVAASLLGAGCSGSRTLALTPHVVAAEGREAFAHRVPEGVAGPEFPILFVTDRAAAPDVGEDANTSFSWRRSRTIRFGVIEVELTPAPDWDALLDRTCGACTDGYGLRIRSIQTLGEVKGLGDWTTTADGRQALLPDALEGIRREELAFQSVVSERLTVTGSDRALVFIHGFNNTLEDAAFRTAEIWHFTGRTSVPIAYSWPAARGGIRGYAYDRESGEYTVVHLKQFLRALSRTPGLERIDIVAHSRGTDVTVTALRELYIEARASGEDAVSSLRLGSLVLAAPDIDMDVFHQRFGAEMLVNAPERTVIYFSPDDDAIWWARWLFDSVRRLGSLVLTDLTEREQKVLTQLPKLELVDCEVSGFGTSHAYVFSHPAAMSDLVLVLRDGAPPGSAQRPLKFVHGAWKLDNDYLRPEGRAEGLE